VSTTQNFNKQITTWTLKKTTTT